MMGGTLIRQHNLIFDIDQNQVGFAHAVCNEDTNQLTSRSQMTSQQTWVLKENQTETEAGTLCNHTSLYTSESDYKSTARSSVLSGWLMLVELVMTVVVLCCGWCMWQCCK